MALHTNLPIYRVAYGLLDAITDLAKNMPRDFKASIGGKLRDECVEIVVLIFRANCAREKAPHLDSLIERLRHPAGAGQDCARSHRHVRRSHQARPPPARRSTAPGIRPGTRAAQVWRVLPDADDCPMCSSEIARELRLQTTVIAPVLCAMHARGIVVRHVDTDGGYSYTRPEC